MDFPEATLACSEKNVDILIHRNFQRHVLMIC